MSDFEGGFSVGGTLVTTGLGNSGSITVADGLNTGISGSWIDLGLGAGSVILHFAFSSAPNEVTSGMNLTATSGANNMATLGGGFGGFDNFVYFFTAGPTFDQNGPTQVGGLAFLSVSFTPEAVPVPGTLALLGLGLAGLGFGRRKVA